MPFPKRFVLFLFGLDITENGKPSALMIEVSEENFEETLSILKQMKVMRKNQREDENVT